MNKKQKTRLITVLSIILILGVAIGLMLYALKQNINLFYTPTELKAVSVQTDQVIRIGGFVKKNSVQFDKSGQSVRFVVTDNKNDIAVTYHGLLPNLFREGQGVVIEGSMDANQVMMATQVLAKHDEKYMPEVLEKEFNAK